MVALFGFEIVQYSPSWPETSIPLDSLSGIQVCSIMAVFFLFLFFALQGNGSRDAHLLEMHCTTKLYPQPSHYFFETEFHQIAQATLEITLYP